MAQTRLDEELVGAAAAGDAEACQGLIGHGASVTVTDNDGWTALHSTVSGGHPSVCALLVNHGADPSAKAEVLLQRLTPMQLAVFAGRLSVVDYFVQTHGEDLFQVAENGSTLDEIAKHVKKDDTMLLHLLALRSERTARAIDHALDGVEVSDRPVRTGRSLEL